MLILVLLNHRFRTKTVTAGNCNLVSRSMQRRQCYPANSKPAWWIMRYWALQHCNSDRNLPGHWLHLQKNEGKAMHELIWDLIFILLGPAGSLMQYAGLNEAWIIMILTEWERGRWWGGKEREGKEGRGCSVGRGGKNIWLVESFRTKMFLKPALNLFLFPFLRETKFLHGNIKSR